MWARPFKQKLSLRHHSAPQISPANRSAERTGPSYDKGNQLESRWHYLALIIPSYQVGGVMVNSKSLKRNRANELWGTILMIDTALTNW